jgi:ParB family chromosome partitioning protein
MVILLPINKLRSEDFPTGTMSKSEYLGLKHSIKEYGILYPIKVLPDGNTYRVIDGRHRLKAAQELGLEDVPCMIVENTPEQIIANMFDVEIFRKNHPDNLDEIFEKKEREKAKLQNQILADLANKLIPKEVLKTLTGNHEIKNAAAFDRLVTSLMEIGNKKLAQEIQKYKEEKQTLLEQLEKAARKNEEWEEKYKALAEEHRVRLSKLKKEVEEEIQERVQKELELRQKAGNIQNEAQLKKLEAEIEKRVRKQVEAEYKSQLEEAESEIEELRAIAEKATKDRESLKREIETLKQQLSSISQLEHTIKNLQKEVEHRQTFISELASLDQVQAELHTLEGIVENLQKKLPILVRIISNEERNELYNRCCVLKKNIDRCCDSLKP